MKCLIVRKEWVDLILSGLKVYEMRSTRTKVRGPIGLIEAGTGTVVGTADLVASLDPIEKYQARDLFSKHRVHDLQLLEKWRFPWVLLGSKRLPNPVSYKHPAGAMIWVDVPDELFQGLGKTEPQKGAKGAETPGPMNTNFNEEGRV